MSVWICARLHVCVYIIHESTHTSVAEAVRCIHSWQMDPVAGID